MRNSNETNGNAKREPALRDAKSKAKSSVLSKAFYWIAVLAVAVAAVLYVLLDWTSAAANISRYLDAVIKSILAVVLCSAAQKILGFVISHAHADTQRAKTVASLLVSIAKYALAIIAFVMILTFFIEDTSSLFTGIGMLGLVVGLGCNKLIADIVAGIFMVFEGDFQVGDVVVIGGWRGTVKDIGVRTTKIEDAGGNIKILNNSNISDVVNNSKALSVASCDVGIEYDESIERVENIIKDNLEYIRERIPAIVDGPFYKGISELGDSAVVMKIIAKCKEEDKFQIQRDLNREIKILFDKHSVGIPYPQVTLSHRPESTENSVSAGEVRRANTFVDAQKAASKGLEDQNS